MLVNQRAYVFLINKFTFETRIKFRCQVTIRPWFPKSDKNTTKQHSVKMSDASKLRLTVCLRMLAGLDYFST